MFGNNDNRQQPANDLSGVGLPPQSQSSPSPQFANPPTNPVPIADAVALPEQDLSIPELSAVTADTPPQVDSAWTPPPAITPAPAGSDDLVQLKQQALSQLSPIVSKLDQTPEEKFRTTMMMIQASDDQSLIRSAYDAAQAITDEKVKAQALLDVINEINYFSQKQNG